MGDDSLRAVAAALSVEELREGLRRLGLPAGGGEAHEVLAARFSAGFSRAVAGAATLHAAAGAAEDDDEFNEDVWDEAAEAEAEEEEEEDELSAAAYAHVAMLCEVENRLTRCAAARVRVACTRPRG